MEFKENGSIQFFYPDNQTPSGDTIKFIEFYSKGYDNQFRKCKLEKRIETLLISGKKFKDSDIEDILSWKTGQACINLCKIDLERVCEITTKIERGVPDKPFSKSSEEQKLYLDFINEVCTCKGIGIVYAIAILYFISNGKYPIYDRFAQTAMTAIKSGCRLGEYVPYAEITISEKRALPEAYSQYCEDMDSIFHEDYTCRDVDKALWVYGHLFNKSEKNWKHYMRNIELI